MHTLKALHDLQNIFDNFRKNSLSKSNDYASYIELFKNPVFSKFNNRTSLAIMVYNYLENKYDYVSDSVKDLYEKDSQSFTDADGLSNIVSMLTPESARMIVNDFTPLFFEYVLKYPNEMHQLRFNASIELIINNKSKWILMNNFILCTTPDKFPVLSCSILTDITLIKKDPHLYYSIHKGSELLLNVCKSQGKDELKLSERELEVVSLISQGKTTKEIASTLHISFETAKKHRSNILNKTNCQNTAELVNVAATMGLV